jgi:tetratricopeptide (TPR) repeat protein
MSISMFLVLVIATGCASGPGASKEKGLDTSAAPTELKPKTAVEKGRLENELLQVRAMTRKRRYSAALQKVRRLLLRYPGNREGRYLMARLHFATGQIVLARAELEALLALEGRVPAYLNDLGVIFIKTGDTVRGVSYLEEAVQADPLLFSARLNLGAFYLKHRDYEKARVHYEDVLDAEPGNLDAALGKSVALRGMRKFKGAEKQLLGVLKRYPSEQRALFNLGVLYYKYMNRPRSAIPMIRRFLRKAPSRSEKRLVAESMLKRIKAKKVPVSKN